MPDPTKLQQLHTNLVGKKLSTVDFNTFASDMGDEMKIKKLYNNLIKRGFNIPNNFDTFKSDLFPSGYPQQQHQAVTTSPQNTWANKGNISFDAPQNNASVAESTSVGLLNIPFIVGTPDVPQTLKGDQKYEYNLDQYVQQVEQDFQQANVPENTSTPLYRFGVEAAGAPEGGLVEGYFDGKVDLVAQKTHKLDDLGTQMQTMMQDENLASVVATQQFIARIIEPVNCTCPNI